MRECAQQLLCQWLEADAAGSVPVLLQLLDVRQHEEACQRAVRPLTLLQAVMHVFKLISDVLGCSILGKGHAWAHCCGLLDHCCSMPTMTIVQVLALIECRRLQPLAMSDEATGGGMSLRQVSEGGLLSAEVALMWRIVCTWLQVCPAALFAPIVGSSYQFL